MSGVIVDVSSQTWSEEVLKAATPVMVFFWADWCKPCLEMGPVIAKVAKECAGVKVVRLNIDDHQKIANTYRVSIVPTVMFFKSGQKLHQSICLQSYQDIKEPLDVIL